jgi:hypothetical protein
MFDWIEPFIRAAYARGCWMAPHAPAVCTERWDDDAWIRYATVFFSAPVAK